MWAQLGQSSHKLVLGCSYYVGQRLDVRLSETFLLLPHVTCGRDYDSA